MPAVLKTAVHRAGPGVVDFFEILARERQIGDAHDLVGHDPSRDDAPLQPAERADFGRLLRVPARLLAGVADLSTDEPDHLRLVPDSDDEEGVMADEE